MAACLQRLQFGATGLDRRHTFHTAGVSADLLRHAVRPQTKAGSTARPGVGRGWQICLGVGEGLMSNLMRKAV